MALDPDDETGDGGPENSAAFLSDRGAHHRGAPPRPTPQSLAHRSSGLSTQKHMPIHRILLYIPITGVPAPLRSGHAPLSLGH